MPLRATPSTNLLARTRAWFGLDQAAMALYLGVSPGLVHSIEAGRRRLTTEVLAGLLPLVQHLPAPEAAGPLVPVGLPAAAPLDAAALDFRRRVCAVQAARLGRELAVLEARALVAGRWARALPALQQAAAEAPPAEAGRTAWRLDWLARQARPLPPEAVTRQHLLRARLAGLAAEAAALAAAAP